MARHPQAAITPELGLGILNSQYDGCVVTTAAVDTHAPTRIGLQPELPLAAIDPSSVRLADRVDQAGSIVATLT
jgi:hypothetical protein